MNPIGYLESCYKDKFGVPRQSGLVPSATARLKIRADLQPEQSLQGLEGFSHVWLIWIFHENKSARFHAKVHPPRLGGENLGLFATRTPHRPNPIGLSLVELVSVEKDGIIVSGVDLMDGTPILDLKPYLPEIEARPEARTGWTSRASHAEIEVYFEPDAEEDLQSWSRSLQVRGFEREALNLRDLICETIRLDPRPRLYRGNEQGGATERRPHHAFRLFDGDVHFEMKGDAKAHVFTILQGVPDVRPQTLRKPEASIKSTKVPKYQVEE